jgi:hypothetical protein
MIESTGTATSSLDEKLNEGNSGSSATSSSSSDEQTNEGHLGAEQLRETSHPASEETDVKVFDHAHAPTSMEIVNENQQTNQSIDEAAVPVSGFGPFRMWINREIRRTVRGPLIRHAGNESTATEVTAEGQIRLELDGKALLVPFDERYIPSLLRQLPTIE